MPKQFAKINPSDCAACGVCMKACPRQAISIYKGMYAKVNTDLCVGCGICAKECPASIITKEVSHESNEKMV